MTTIIYGLVDPRTQELRYVGKTGATLYSRTKHHENHAKVERTYKANWIRSLLAVGLKPESFVIEEVKGDGCESEIHHIAYFKSIGCRLTNVSLGGEGVTGPKTEGHKQKIATALRGNKNGIGNKSGKGKQMPQQVKERIRATLQGRVYSVETLARMSASARVRVSKPLSEEHKARLSAANKEFHRARKELKAMSDAALRDAARPFLERVDRKELERGEDEE